MYEAFQPMEDTIKQGGRPARMVVMNFYLDLRLQDKLDIATSFLTWAQYRLPKDDNERIVKALFLIC
jgi:hypothetical protein